MNNYTVYKHTAPNGKVYIGITSLPVEKRWKNGSGYNNNLHFKNAISKYGWENIKHEILFIDLSKEEAEKKEIELIAVHQSNVKKYGYNVENGGNCIGKMNDETKEKIRQYQKTLKHKPLSAETKQKISENRKGIRPKRDYKHLSPETKQKIRDKMKGIKIPEDVIKKRVESRKGYTHSEETRNKISASNKGRVSPNKGVPTSEKQKKADQ